MRREYSKILHRILKEGKLGEAAICFVPPEKINSAALVYREKGMCHILCRNDLPEEIKLFVILHEFGHVALDELDRNPHKKWTEAAEKRINLWALEKLEPYLNVKFYADAKHSFEVSEELGFSCLKSGLKNNCKKERGHYGQ